MFLLLRLIFLCMGIFTVSVASAGIVSRLFCKLRLEAKSLFVKKSDLPLVPRANPRPRNNLVEYFRDSEKWRKDRDFIENLSREDADALFRKLLSENKDFSTYVASTVWKYEGEGREVGRQVSTLQRAILYGFNLKFPGYVVSSQSVEVETLKTIVGHSPEFVHWMNKKEVDPDWQKDEVLFAAKILREWEEETKKRNTPVKAELGNYLNKDYEKRYTFAVIGQAQYVSSQDSKTWIKVGGSAKSPDQIPRWSGNVDQFKQGMKEKAKKANSIEVPKTPQSFLEAHAEEEAPVVSVSSGMAILHEGKLVSVFEKRDFVDEFIRYKAFGYHVTNTDRLESILENGWLLHQRPTNLTESSRDFGLHLSTHLGVDYTINGKTVVLRTPLEEVVYERRDTSYYGHVRRLYPLPAAEVPTQLEFSPDGGISWYPLNQDFIRYMNEGLLPVLRGTPQ